jgi:imidazolonepropionase-like amidohydrolase
MKALSFLIVGSLAVAMAVRATAQGASDVKAIVGATVIGAGTATLPNAAIIIDGGRIVRVGPLATTAIPANASVVDAKGKFVMPGLADMHNHVQSGSLRPQQNLRLNLSVLLAYGVTTVFNPSISLTDFADLKTAAAGTVPLPRFFGAGPSITVKGDLLGAQTGSPTPESPADARAAIQALKSAGVDAIKIVRDDMSWASKQRFPLMKTEVLSALVDQAHREGLTVFVHAPLLEHAKDVLRAGADGLLHGIVDKPVDRELLDLLVKNRAVYVPTMTLYEAVGNVTEWARRESAYDERRVLSPLADSFAAPSFVQQVQFMLNDTAFTKSHLPVARANLKAVAGAGVPVVMGTDSGFPGVLMGVASQLELALMVEAGLTPEAVLQSATINAARMLGREKELGSIEAGKLADLLVLDASPLDDVGNVRRIYRVIKDGVAYEPAQLLSGFRITGPPRPAAN